MTEPSSHSSKELSMIALLKNVYNDSANFMQPVCIIKTDVVVDVRAMIFQRSEK
jgi:hypothetical protein